MNTAQAAEIFDAAMRRVAGDVDGLTVAEVDAGLVRATDNWRRGEWSTEVVSLVFGVAVTIDELPVESGYEDFSGPRGAIYGIGSRFFLKTARNVSHHGWEWDDWNEVREVKPVTRTVVTHTYETVARSGDTV